METTISLVFPRLFGIIPSSSSLSIHQAAWRAWTWWSSAKRCGLCSLVYGWAVRDAMNDRESHLKRWKSCGLPKLPKCFFVCFPTYLWCLWCDFLGVFWPWFSIKSAAEERVSSWGGWWRSQWGDGHDAQWWNHCPVADCGWPVHKESSSALLIRWG